MLVRSFFHEDELQSAILARKPPEHDLAGDLQFLDLMECLLAGGDDIRVKPGIHRSDHVLQFPETGDGDTDVVLSVHPPLLVPSTHVQRRFGVLVVDGRVAV